MSVLVDTSVWSLALRRKPGALNHAERGLVFEWTELVKDDRVLLIGDIRQEILSRIAHPEQFERLKDYLRNFHDIALLQEDYERAAEFSNTLMKKGVVSTPVDELIAAVAFRLNIDVFSTDPDFKHFARHLPIRLYS